MYKINFIKNKIKTHDVISFDIFDTLIKRDVSKPTDVFELTFLSFNSSADFQAIKEFKDNRIKAEQIARKNKQTGEVNIDEIYENLVSDYGNFTQKLKEIEKKVEIEVCVANPKLYELYKLSIELGKKIIITTDMYLDRNTIIKILNNNGYYEYDHLFLSSDENQTKNNGELFENVKSQYHLKSLLHIGDNRKSDYLNAKKHGLDAVHIPIHNNNLKHSKKSRLPQLNKFINNRIDKKSNYFFQLGYECLGPLLYSYSIWINKNIDKNDRLFFLARDGHLMKQSYDLIFPENNSKYIYASRRGYIVPSLNRYEEMESMLENMFIGRFFTIKDIVKKLGLSENVLTGSNIKVDYVYKTTKDLLDNQETKLFLNKIYNEVVNNSKKEELLLKKYLDRVEFKNNVSVVDIGWYGNMQHALNKVSDGKYKIHGYYIGCKYNKNLNANDFTKGYLFDSSTSNKSYENAIKTYTDVFEMLFTFNSGSFVKFDNDELNPVLKDKEYNHTVYDATIAMIQNGALSFVKDYKDSYISNFIDINIDESFVRINDYGTNPSKIDIKNILRISKKDFIVNRSFIYYLIHPSKFIIDFSNSWKVGFLYNVFKLKLPYYTIYSHLIGFYHKLFN